MLAQIRKTVAEVFAFIDFHLYGTLSEIAPVRAYSKAGAYFSESSSKVGGGA